jgi:hypothetical protein
VIGLKAAAATAAAPQPLNSLTQTAAMSSRFIDSHVHVWAPVERKDEFPFYVSASSFSATASIAVLLSSTAARIQLYTTGSNS